MKRVLIATLVLGLLTMAAPALAAGEPDSKPKFDFSAKAAGIEAIVKAAPSPVLARAQQTNPTKKSFWKTPWPYVIIGGAVAVGVLIANGSNSAY